MSDPSTNAVAQRSGPLQVQVAAHARLGLLGNPNVGKTTLFNRLTGLRHKTSNFPGTTLEARSGRLSFSGPSASAGASDCCGDEPQTPSIPAGDAELVDLPGVYSLHVEALESRVVRDALSSGPAAPMNGLCVIADATNLARNLRLVGEALRLRLPTVVAVNMVDIARRRGIHVDPARLSDRLGCPVVLVSARTGEGVTELLAALRSPSVPSRTPPGGAGAQATSELAAWADEACAHAATADPAAPARIRADALTDRADSVLTHPLLGTAIFAALMFGLFYALFSIAKLPMDLLGGVFDALADSARALLPEGIVVDFLADGVIAGVGATVIFLPQICLLFFLISLLEDTGYLARAAFVTDRLLRPFGLPGHAFVPLLSAHACALPAIMACRAIPDARQRLATILVAPFMTCSARLPVYALLTSLLCLSSPAQAELAFVVCYALGIAAGILSALVARRTILRGSSRPLALELPSYKWPSVRTALTTTAERGWVFLRKAGTTILAVSIILWWLGAYPKVEPPAEASALRATITAAMPPDESAAIERRAAELEVADAKARSFLGRAGRTAQPLFEPLGYDWKLTVGVLASFAAREVFVSTMAVVVAGEDADAGDAVEDEGIRTTLATATRDDASTLIFNPATSWSLLVFFVLAMQCLPTLVVTAREAGHIKWAILQLFWMSLFAYAAAWAARALVVALGAA
ncbi:MAG: ferrous iron transporter B [Phycisphaerales bacterium]